MEEGREGKNEDGEREGEEEVGNERTGDVIGYNIYL